ncbi:hypothetical protein HDU87_007377 [Geranomyces variabilis]|uniref:Uncharacterized protein n=1 Tax=Geranomyces variabilis TaxID=109894 RepID=A0AAD5TQ05_9FUNG|nr:hypothetical protein HDU87_007377 [Geranomyces variabilis]
MASGFDDSSSDEVRVIAASDFDAHTASTAVAAAIDAEQGDQAAAAHIKLRKKRWQKRCYSCYTRHNKFVRAKRVLRRQERTLLPKKAREFTRAPKFRSNKKHKTTKFVVRSSYIRQIGWDQLAIDVDSIFRDPYALANILKQRSAQVPSRVALNNSGVRAQVATGDTPTECVRFVSMCLCLCRQDGQPAYGKDLLDPNGALTARKFGIILSSIEEGTDGIVPAHYCRDITLPSATFEFDHSRFKTVDDLRAFEKFGDKGPRAGKRGIPGPYRPKGRLPGPYRPRSDVDEDDEEDEEEEEQQDGEEGQEEEQDGEQEQQEEGQEEEQDGEQEQQEEGQEEGQEEEQQDEEEEGQEEEQQDEEEEQPPVVLDGCPVAADQNVLAAMYAASNLQDDALNWPHPGDVDTVLMSLQATLMVLGEEEGRSAWKTGQQSIRDGGYVSKDGRKFVIINHLSRSYPDIVDHQIEGVVRAYLSAAELKRAADQELISKIVDACTVVFMSKGYISERPRRHSTATRRTASLSAWARMSSAQKAGRPKKISAIVRARYEGWTDKDRARHGAKISGGIRATKRARDSASQDDAPAKRRRSFVNQNSRKEQEQGDLLPTLTLPSPEQVESVKLVDLVTTVIAHTAERPPPAPTPEPPAHVQMTCAATAVASATPGKSHPRNSAANGDYSHLPEGHRFPTCKISSQPATGSVIPLPSILSRLGPKVDHAKVTKHWLL